MKKLFITAVLFLTTLTAAHAQKLEAKSMHALLNDIENAEFTYKETGMIFGFISIQSCLFVSKDIAIFKNYCFPVKKYPARGFTIISKKYGMIDLYEEQLDPTLLKRDIQITQFPEILQPYLGLPFPVATLTDLSTMIEKIHFKYNPGCWSTNWSFYTETNDAACSVPSEHVVGFDEWSAETQAMTLDEASWLQLMKKINAKLVR